MNVLWLSKWRRVGRTAKRGVMQARRGAAEEKKEEATAERRQRAPPGLNDEDAGGADVRMAQAEAAEEASAQALENHKKWKRG